jgi:hypothetical protein
MGREDGQTTTHEEGTHRTTTTATVDVQGREMLNREKMGEIERKRTDQG